MCSRERRGGVTHVGVAMSDTIDLGSKRFVDIGDHPAIREGGVATWYARLQNVLAAWSEVLAVPDRICQHAASEILVVLPDAGAVLRAGDLRADAPARSICILPAGPTVIEPSERGRVIRFFSPVPETLASLPVNAEDYVSVHASVRPFEQTCLRTGRPEIRVYPIDLLAAGKPGRPPTIQSETMNLMWIERNGPQDRGQLAPHCHDDFEEGALVVEGEYIQHLRTPWNADARQWRDDEHRTCGPGTVTIVPPTVIHTTEAISGGRHVMLNIFAPARADHIKSGLVLNCDEYQPVTPIQPSTP